MFRIIKRLFLSHRRITATRVTRRLFFRKTSILDFHVYISEFLKDSHWVAIREKIGWSDDYRVFIQDMSWSSFSHCFFQRTITHIFYTSRSSKTTSDRMKKIWSEKKVSFLKHKNITSRSRRYRSQIVLSEYRQTCVSFAFQCRLIVSSWNEIMSVLDSVSLKIFQWTTWPLFSKLSHSQTDFFQSCLTAYVFLYVPLK